MKKSLLGSARTLLLLFVILLTSGIVKASHIVGADMFYTWITGNQYKITVILYGDCGPASATSFASLPTSHPQVCIFDGPTAITSLSLDPDAASAAGGTEITPVCADSLGRTQCTNTAFSLPGIKKFVYTKTYTFPGTSANYRMVYNSNNGGTAAGAGRAAAITNMSAPGATLMQLVDTLNNTLGANNSPILTVVPTPFFAAGIVNCYTPGAIDLDMDSLSFDLVTPGNGTGSCGAVGGPAGYALYPGTAAWPGQPITAATPLETAPPPVFNFDGSNGQICFNGTPQRSVVVFNIREYRGGVFIGSSQREMTFLVRTFPSSPPNMGTPIIPTASSLTMEDSTHFHVCGATGTFSFSIMPSESITTNHITCSASGLGTSGLVFSVLNNNTNAPTCTITGDANTMAPGIYNFFITMRDDGCPISSSRTIPFRIQIFPVPTINITKLSDADCVHGAIFKITPGSITGGTSGSPWMIKIIDSALQATVGAPTDTFKSHSDSGPYYDTLEPHSSLPGSLSGIYYFTVYSAVTNECAIADTVKLPQPPQLHPHDSAVSPSFCGADNGFIVIKNLNPAGVDTVTFTSPTGASVSQVHIVDAAGNITISSLVSGAYSNIVVHYGYCTSDTQATETLIDSPFHFRDIQTTNATKCGYCDGMVTIRGLHPSQIDSIAYLYVSPTSPTPLLDTIAAYVGPDSVIIFSGMCKGSYNNFVIWTQTSNDCIVSPTTVGIIDAPGIHAEFDTSIHLGCHGDTLNLNNLSTPASDLHYAWQFGDGYTTDATSPKHVYTNTNNSTYTVKLVINNGFCTDSFKVDITLNNMVKSDFTMDPPSFMCQQGTLHLANAATGTSPSSLWIFGDGTTSTTTSPDHIYANAGTYDVMLVASNFVPCFDTMKRTIMVDSMGPISMNVTSNTVCKGQTINYTAIYPNSGRLGNTWTFSDGFTMNNSDNFNHAFEGVGSFTVDLSTRFRACPDQATSQTFKVFDYPTLYLGPDMTICTGSNPLELKDDRNAANPKATWAWNTNESTAGITVVKPGDYVASVTIDGCTTWDTVSVVKDCYMNIPNVFTPNGDGLNDYFFPRDLTKGLVKFNLSIYNRWGQLIFETATTEGKGWDGTLNGQPQPSGVYVYSIDGTFKDGQIEHHTGNITLLK